VAGSGKGSGQEALKRVAVALKAAEVNFALGGGYAAWARGAPEPEHDVDFVVAEEHAARASQVLQDAGLRVEQPPEDWLFKVFTDGTMVDVAHRLNGVPVDHTILDRAEEREVLSIPMPVLSVTDVVVTKLNALTEQECDYAKLLPVARALRELIDWDQVRENTAGNPYAEAFLFLVKRLDIVRQAS
jgi:Nucleotidyl transferase of unknown function (DUF2204)